MVATTPELQVFIEREQIRDCFARLARGEDRRDADTLKGCYWPDSSFDYGMYAGSFSEYLAWVVPGAEVITNTQHILGQSVIELAGDTAKAETHVISYHRVNMAAEGQPSEERDTVIGGRYLDQMERRTTENGGSEWRIMQRTMLYDWFQDWGGSVDWSKGVMGYPFSKDHYSGTAKDDFSKIFFGGHIA